MSWQEIILHGLNQKKDPVKIAANAEEAAPPAIKEFLTTFPDSINHMMVHDPKACKKIDAVLLLLWYHYMLTSEAPPLHYAETEISLAAAALAKKLQQKKLQAEYYMHSGEIFYQQKMFSEAEQTYRKALKIYVLLTKENPNFILEVANTLNDLGNVYSDLNQLKKSQRMYEKALELYEKHKKDPDSVSNISMVLNNLGNIHSEVRKFSKAESYYREALTLVQNAPHPEQFQADIAEIMGNMGTLYWNTAQFVQSESYYKKALAIYRELIKDENQYMLKLALTLSNLGILYSDMGIFSKAKKAFNESLAIREYIAKLHTEYEVEMASSLHNLGILYSEIEHFKKAEIAFSISFSIYQNLAQNDPDVYTKHVAIALDNLGLLYMKTKQFDLSEQKYNKALELRKKLARTNDSYYYLVARTLNDLGTLYWETGKFSKAESALQKALSIYENKSSNDTDIAETYHNLGLLYYEMKEYKKAEIALQKALHIRENLVKNGFCTHASYIEKTLIILGNLYCDINDPEKAESVYIEALNRYEELSKEYPEIYAPKMAMTLTNLGNLYSERNKMSQAKKAYQNAYTLYKTLADAHPAYIYEMALILTNLGVFYYDITNYHQAFQAYTRALTIARELARENPETYNLFLAHVLGNMGNLYVSMQDFDVAKKMYAEALDICTSLAQEYPDTYVPEIAGLLNNLGSVYYEEDNLSDAEGMYTKALNKYRKLAEQNPDAFLPDVAYTLQDLGNVYVDTGRKSQAKAIFNEALTITKERNLWFTAAQIYHNYSFISDSASAEAVKMLELGILSSDEKEYKYAQKGKNESVYLKLMRKTKDLHQIFGILEALRDPDLLSLHWDTKKLHTVSKKSLPEKIPPLPVSAHIPQNMVFLYMEHLEENILYMAITDEGLTLSQGGTEFFEWGMRLLNNLKYQALIKNEKLKELIIDFDRCSEKWAQKMPSTIRELLSEKNIIMLSPGSMLSFLPLESLFIDDAYLCLSKTVMRATSFNNLQKSEGSVRGPSLVVGNPWPSHTKDTLHYNEPYSRNLVYLKNAEREAQILAKNINNCTLLTGGQAIAEKFLKKISDYSIIHFAGHAAHGRILFFAGPMTRFPPEFEPEEIAVLRKMRRTRNGNTIYMTDEWDPVTDIDIRNIQLKEGALIFLNACQTGQQKYAGGGHFQGLTQAFLTQGASHVISSLVPIYDKSSRYFTLSFFNELLSKVPVTESLKKSRIKTKKKYTSHISWLPYIHYGPITTCEK